MTSKQIEQAEIAALIAAGGYFEAGYSSSIGKRKKAFNLQMKEEN